MCESIESIRKIINDMCQIQQRIDNIFIEQAQKVIKEEEKVLQYDIVKTQLESQYSTMQALNNELFFSLSSMELCLHSNNTSDIIAFNFLKEVCIQVSKNDGRLRKKICFRIDQRLYSFFNNYSKTTIANKQQAVQQIITDALTNPSQIYPFAENNFPKRNLVIRIYYPLYEQMDIYCKQAQISYSTFLENALYSKCKNHF